HGKCGKRKTFRVKRARAVHPVTRTRIRIRADPDVPACGRHWAKPICAGVDYVGESIRILRSTCTKRADEIDLRSGAATVAACLEIVGQHCKSLAVACAPPDPTRTHQQFS